MGNSVRILHIVTQMEAGGAQGAAIRNAEYMREKGISSSVLFLYRKRGVYDDHDCVSWLLENPPQKIWDYLKIMRRLYAFLRREKPDAIISYTHYANVMSGFFGRVSLVPRVISSHRNPTYSYPKACRVADKLIGTLGFYSTAICVSNTVHDSFEGYPERYKKRLRIIRNGIDLKSFSQANRAAGDFSEPRPDRKFRYITVGRLHHQKNHKILIDAMSEVENEDIELWIIGDGELREMLAGYAEECGVSDRVRFLGEVPPSNMKSLLGEADAFLFPSKYEAFGFAVVEAMAGGLPVICSDIPAMHEVVSDAGILVSLDDPSIWAKTLQRTAEQPSLLYDMSLRSRERAREFSLDEMAEGYIDAAQK